MKFYESYEQYSTMLTTFLLMEVACGIRTAFSTIDNSPLFTECIVEKDSVIKFKINETDSSLFGFQLKITCSKNQASEVPKIGDLIILEIISESNKCFTMFAYIKEVSFIQKGDEKLSGILRVITRSLDFDIYKIRFRTLRVLIGILVALNLMKALEEFQTSPLLPLILHPNLHRRNYYSYGRYRRKTVLKLLQCLKLKENYDFKQMNAVFNIANQIELQKPKICLVQGPPGTGKTDIATMVILKVLCTQDKSEKQNLPLRILVCTRSKSEIDEILIRLSNEEKRLGMSHDLVRVGNPDNIHKRVKQFSLQVIAENIEAKNKENMDSLEYSRKLADAKKLILNKANVIFCTLSMCLSEQMNFGKENPISVCIIDEAAQINEIDILKPLSFGIKTLVLLGDKYKSSLINEFLSEKLISKSGIERKQKFSNSLFLRLLGNFKEGVPMYPVMNLNNQYRMNKKIMFLINRYFYDRDRMCWVKKKPISNLSSCSIFSLNLVSNQNAEATFAGNLIFCILNAINLEDFENSKSIGVIVPCSSSKQLLIEEINQWISNVAISRRKFFNIDVDTISAFKNQEKDIIIVSCTHKNNYFLEPAGEQWLYSAISKAKMSLILYGAEKMFRESEESSIWKSIIQRLKNEKNFFKIDVPADSIKLEELLLETGTRTTSS